MADLRFCAYQYQHLPLMLCESAGGMPNGLGSTCCGTATPSWSRTGRGTRCSTVRRRWP